jgi:hypothetical protein
MIQGVGMFGQNNDDQNQQQNDYGNVFNQPPAEDAGVGGAQGPAPGAPIGPIGDDQPITTTVPTQDLNTPELAENASEDTPSDVPADDLLEIKQDALHELTPLVGHLEQSPEEKFRTTMMMIQASDDHSLIKTAYDAAKQITDEKTRAQALLDVVNEINYFTQHSQ